MRLRQLLLRESLSMLSVAAWNVNSVRSRLPQLLDWLRADKPDVVLLQETKCTNDVFPAMEIEELGYNIAMHGEKSYNGVAILSKYPLDDITRGMPGDEDYTHCRYIEAVVNAPTVMRVVSLYVPNGQTTDSEKFPYKLQFLDKLNTHINTLLGYDEKLVIGGDYNIAPQDIDVHNPSAWAGTVLTHDEVRSRFNKILHLGMYDAGALTNNHGFTWWDYRAGAFASDDGLRIDHLLLSPQAADALSSYHVAKQLRGNEKASDHAPVVASFTSP